MEGHPPTERSDGAAKRTAVPDARSGAAGARLSELSRRRGIGEAPPHLPVDAAERARLAFIAMASHELRAPLNAIIGFSDAALHGVRGPLPAAYRDYFVNIHRVGKHLEAIVGDLLDFARLEIGRIAFDVATVAAAPLVEEARSVIAPAAERKGIDITAVRLDEAWLIRADATRTRQILVNLLTNAVKFTPAGGSVGTAATEALDRFLELTVWDTGIGIAPDEQELVFEAFHQVRQDRQPAEPSGDPGSGLGLAIARQLARAMGGDILLSSAPGRGSRFILRLPLARAGA